MIGSSIRTAAEKVGVLMQRRNYMTEPHIRLVQELQRRETSLILDIGANDGGYGKKLYGAGYRGKMVSFEPLPGAHAELCRTVSPYIGWSVGPAVALSSQNGTAVFHEAGNSTSSSLLTMNKAHVEAAPDTATVNSFEVRTAQLDAVAVELGISAPFFLKIDTQGSEAMVLDGGSKTLHLATGLQIEMSLEPLYDGQVLWRDMDDRLQQEGFQLWDMVPGFRHRKTGQLKQFDGVYFR